ncbi:MAG TPA: terminase gpA endonuclease subunit [Planctomycetota bacterium]|nr:terminase gpA endonuclease subunit [Planctomycetota bacterium]
MGLYWIIPARTGRVMRRILIDTDYWKSFVYARLAVAMGDPGCLSLFGRDAAAHQLIAEHITAETCVKVSAQGRVVDEWKWKESRPDNHWFDCLVGCAVAANLAGATLPGVIQVRKRRRERVDFGEWQRRVRDGKA